jgi:hypothetical protein
MVKRDGDETILKELTAGQWFGESEVRRAAVPCSPTPPSAIGCGLAYVRTGRVHSPCSPPSPSPSPAAAIRPSRALGSPPDHPPIPSSPPAPPGWLRGLLMSSPPTNEGLC